MAHRDHRNPHPGHPPQLGREHAARDHHHLRLDLALLGDDLPHVPVADLDPRHARVREDVAAAAPRPVSHREGELGGIEITVGGKPGAPQHAVRGHQREHLLRIVRRDQLQGQPERLGPAGLAAKLLHPLLAGGEADPAALGPAGVELRLVLQPAVELHRVHHHLRQRDRAAQLANEPRRVERRAGGELVAVEQDHVVPAQLGEVVGDRGPADPAADDHAARTRGKLAPTRHLPPRARHRSSGSRPSHACGRSAWSRTRGSRTRAPRPRSGRRPTSPRGSRT